MVALRRHTILLVLALISFGASIGSSFHFDDYSVFSDPAVTSPAGWSQVWSLARTRPLTYLTFWLNYQVNGRNPIGWHAVNIALHLGAVWLAFEVLAKLLPGRAAFIGAAIFAIHPIQAEAVNYVFARSTLLMTVLCLAALAAWTRGRLWHAVAWFAAALLAKEECVTLPLFLLLLHLSISRNSRELKPIATMFALAALAGLRVLFAVAVTPGANVGTRAGLSAFRYFATQGGVILHYLRLVILPWNFALDPDISSAPNWLAWIIIIVGIIAASRWFTAGRAGFWFIGGLALLLPSSSIFAATDLAADRRMYLPMIAFSALIGLALQKLNPYLVGLILVVLAALSFQRTEVWQTEESLWRDAVAKAPRKVRPRIQLARSLNPRDALAELQIAKKIAPDDPAVASELGRVYLETASPAEALSEFGRALALDPNSPQALTNRGVALLMLNQTEAARQDFQRALSLNPCLYEARLNASRVGLTLPPEKGCTSR
jgi:tetratricopeptide (TPR) repeat protein